MQEFIKKSYILNNQDNSWRFLCICLFVLAILAGVYIQFPALKDYFVVNDDVRQHTFWMVKFHDHELFKNDIFSTYASYFSPYGFQGLYYILTFLFDPLFIGKGLGIILYAITGLFLLKTGEALYSRLFGVLLFMFFIFFPPHIFQFAGGLQRAFGFPLLVILIHYLAKRNLTAASLILLLQILLYPAIYPLCQLTVFLYMLFNKHETKEFLNHKSNIFILIYPLLIFVFAIWLKVLCKPEFLGDLVTKKDMLGNPAFYLGGRSPYLPIPEFPTAIKRFLLANKVTFSTLFAFLVASSCIFILAGKKIIHPLKIWLAIFISSTAFYYLAGAFLFYLYIPERYVEYSFPLLGIILFALPPAVCISSSHSKLLKTAFLILILYFAYFMHSSAIRQGIGCTVNLEDNTRELCSFLSTLPKNSTVAADPYLSDNISTFSRRKVVVTFELGHPWFKKYAALIRQRTLDFYDAYYSQEAGKLKEFCRKYDIDYLVISRRDFSLESMKNIQYYYEPINTEIRLMLSSRTQLYLFNFPIEKCIYNTTDGNYSVISVKDTL